MKNKKIKKPSAASKLKIDPSLLEYVKQFDNYYKALTDDRPITVEQLDPLQNEIELMLADTVKRIRQYERDLTKVEGDDEELEVIMPAFIFECLQFIILMLFRLQRKLFAGI